MTQYRRLRVLISAFACEPDEGSEPEVGWKWAHEMAKCCDITVVTQTKNRNRIESWGREHPEHRERVGFSYLELGSAWRRIKKRIPGGMYLYYALWQWRLRGHVATLLRNEDFDLIHHVTFASFRMPVFAGGKPVIWGPVGGAETAPMELLKGHGTFLGRMREQFRNLNTRAAGRLVRYWEPTLRSGGIALASTPSTAQVLELAGVPCRLMPTIGYDGSTSPETRPPYPSGAPLRLIFVGRLHLLKGLHLILQALASLTPGSACLTIVGTGPERDRLVKQVKDLGLTDAVEFRGFVPRKDLSEVFSRHDLLVAPSLYESGGLSVLEAFACSLPAVVLDCGGHAISVAEGCGIKVPPTGDASAVIRDLAAAIRSYQEDRSLLATHGREARKQLAERYSWSKKRKDMLAMYYEVFSTS
jgi:glycosyltransferase involved in cell wall biosynthesis